MCVRACEYLCKRIAIAYVGRRRSYSSVEGHHIDEIQENEGSQQISQVLGSVSTTRRPTAKRRGKRVEHCWQVVRESRTANKRGNAPEYGSHISKTNRTLSPDQNWVEGERSSRNERANYRLFDLATVLSSVDEKLHPSKEAGPTSTQSGGIGDQVCLSLAARLVHSC